MKQKKTNSFLNKELAAIVILITDATPYYTVIYWYHFMANAFIIAIFTLDTYIHNSLINKWITQTHIQT